MIRLLGVFVTVLVLYAALMASSENARTVGYHSQLAGQLGFYGVLTVGVGVLIVAGGIDLSIGSVVGFCAVLFGLLMKSKAIAFTVAGVTLSVPMTPLTATAVTVATGALIGLAHGLLVTRLRLQPFLVTLCSMFIFRGLARGLVPSAVAPDPSSGWLRDLLIGGFGDFGRNQVFSLLAAALVMGLLLHFTRFGRYLFAIGANEEAARYAGIPTERYKILAYVICSTLAGLGGVLYLLGYGSAAPASAGNMLELYAITGAVLGGCSLRGGEGNVIGMVLGTAMLPILSGLCSFLGISNELEFVVIGIALLLGTIADELLKRRAERRGRG